MFFSIHDLGDLAESRIMSTEGEAVIPLSDLISMAADANRQEAMAALQRLAALEGRPTFFSLREWMAYRLQWQLDHLDAIEDFEEPELTAYWQVQELLGHWEFFGEPLDVPPLNPFVRSYVEMADTEGGISRTVVAMQDWIKNQRSLLDVVDHLLAAGLTSEVDLLAQNFERALKSAQAHLHLAQAELTIVRQAVSDGPSEWEQIKTHNLKVLEKRRRG